MFGAPWLPAFVLLAATNTAPVLASWLLRHHGNAPLDGGLVLGDGQRLFGDHKTWRGLLAATIAGATVAWLFEFAPWLGALAGTATIAGDALSSCVKRRLALPPGTITFGLDQVPEAVLPLAVAWRALRLDLLSFSIAIALFAVLDFAASHVLATIRHRGAREVRAGNTHS